MARRPRQLPAEGMFHLIGRANHTERLFRHEVDFLAFFSILKRLMPPRDFFIRNYTLMHTHYHLVAWIENTANLASYIKSLHLTYYYYYLKRYGYRGHLWHSRYRSIPIESEEQRVHCGRYVEINPVHAGICRDPVDYKWSSARYYVNGEPDPLIRLMDPAEEKSLMQKSVREGYRRFLLAGIDMNYQALKREFECEKKQLNRGNKT